LKYSDKTLRLHSLTNVNRNKCQLLVHHQRFQLKSVAYIIPGDEIQNELQQEGASIFKCISIMCKGGRICMERVLAKSQEIIDDLLTNGAMIYWKRHRVNLYHPKQVNHNLYVAKSQKCSEHTVAKCTKQNKCTFCSGPNTTRQCTNLQPKSS